MRTHIGKLAAALLIVITSTVAIAATKEGSPLEGVKCLLVGKKAANADKSSKWKDGEVYFCCDGCLGKYEKMSKKDRQKIAPQANHQLVATKQYKQGGCPFSGGEIKEKMTVKFKGAEIGFCCEHCKEKAEKMSDEDKLAKLFGEDAFKKAKFKLVKKEKK